MSFATLPLYSFFLFLMHRTSSYYLLIKLGVLVALLTSCEKDPAAPAPTPQPNPPTTQPLGPHGFVRVINSLAIDPTKYQLRNDSVQLNVKTKKYGRGLGAGSTSQYYPMEVGAITADVYLMPASESSWHWMPTNLTVEENKRYSLLVTNSNSFSQTKLIREETLPTPVPGKAQLRLINVASGYSPVHIEEVGGDFQADVDWGKTLTYVPVAARTYNLSTARQNVTVKQQFNQTITLEPGKAYTLVLRGSFAPDYPQEQAGFTLMKDE